MMSNEVNVKIGENEIKVELERPELIYGIEGLYYNEFPEEKEAYIEVLHKKVPISDFICKSSFCSLILKSKFHFIRQIPSIQDMT